MARVRDLDVPPLLPQLAAAEGVVIPGPVIQAAIGHALQKAFGPDDEEVQRTEAEQAGGGRGRGPRCAVCGGPLADGSGCEFCPKVFNEGGTK